MWTYGFRYNRSRSDDGVFTNLDAAYQGGIRPDRCAPPHDCFGDGPVLVERPWIQIVGEDSARADEDLVFDRDTVIHADVVLDLDAVSNGHAGVDEHVLAKIATCADPGSVSNVALVPDVRSFADFDVVFDTGSGVYVRHVQISLEETIDERRPRTLQLTPAAVKDSIDSTVLRPSTNAVSPGS